MALPKEILLSEDYLSDTNKILSVMMKKSLLDDAETIFSEIKRAFRVKDYDLLYQELVELKKEFSFKVFHQGSQTLSMCNFPDNNSFIFLDKEGNNYVSIECYTTNELLITKIREIIKKYEISIKDSPKGTIYVLIQTKSGFSARYLNEDYVPLIRENYSNSTLEAHDRTIEQFNKENPSGFISIFSGPPGSGKSFLLRSLVGEIENSTFLFIPPSMVREIGGPHLISAFLQLKDKLDLNDDDDDSFGQGVIRVKGEHSNKKIVLILEDADEVLAPRNETDLAGISSILNLTDGMIGKSLNMRILATTNSISKSFDKAIMRPGRLCSHSLVDKLPFEQCVEILGRLYKENACEIPLSSIEIKPYTLAEVYNIVNGQKEIKNESKVGF